jgi:hypothetical protein
MTGVTGSGLWPGSDALEASSVVVGDLVDLRDGVAGMPFLPTLAGRGPWGDRLGLASGLLAELPTELGPHGWKLADRPGRDLGRVQSYAREDLDAIAVAAHGYAGPLVVSALGPLTLAASLYLARGDRVLSDPGAVREVAESLAVGIAERLVAVCRAVPGVELTVLVHEPLLAQVLAGVLPSFSGYSALRRVPGPLAGERLAAVVAGAREGGASAVVVHGGTAWSSLPALRASGADGFALAVAGLGEPGWERVAETVEGGMRLWAEVPPQASSQCAGPDVVGQADTVTRPWRSVGLPASGLADVVVLAGDPPEQSSPDDARAALAGAVRCARLVIERSQT